MPSFRDPTRLMFPAGYKSRVLALLTAYSDESGTHAGSHIFTVAGCLSDSKRWEVFDRRWRKFLEHYGLEFFHMTDFENRQGPYKYWSDSDRRRALTRALNITTQTVLFAFGSAIVRRDFDALRKEDKTRLGNEYLLCTNHCAQFIAKWQIEAGRDELVAHVYDAGAPGYGLMQEVATNTIRDEQRSRQFKLLSITFARSRQFPALQVADLVAYEVAKQAALVAGFHTRAMRFPAKRLFDAIPFKGQFFDAEGLAKTLGERRGAK